MSRIRSQSGRPGLGHQPSESVRVRLGELIYDNIWAANGGFVNFSQLPLEGTHCPVQYPIYVQP